MSIKIGGTFLIAKIRIQGFGSSGKKSGKKLNFNNYEKKNSNIIKYLHFLQRQVSTSVIRTL